MRYFVNQLDSDEARVQQQLASELESGAEARHFYGVQLERFIAAVLKAPHDEDGGVCDRLPLLVYSSFQVSTSDHLELPTRSGALR